MTMMGSLLRVTITVEVGYRGVSAKTIEVYTPSSSTACGFAFQQGERYLAYALRTEDSELMVSLCTSTRPAKYAEEDISYLRSLSTLPPVSTIFGTVWRYTHDPNFKPKFHPSIMDLYRPPEQDYIAMEPAPGTIVIVKVTMERSVVRLPKPMAIGGSLTSLRVVILCTRKQMMRRSCTHSRRV
jgi:hypothetical protein